MLLFGATTLFFFYFGKDIVSQKRIFPLCEDVKVWLNAICPLLEDENSIGCVDHAPSFCSRAVYSKHVVVFTLLNSSFPGGAAIFRMVLLTSYHLSSRFKKAPSVLRVDVTLDADYEAESVLPFRDYLLSHLKITTYSDVHTLTIRKGHHPKMSNRTRIRRYVEETGMRWKVEFQLVAAANQKDLLPSLASQLAREMRVPVPAIKDISFSSDRDVSFTVSAFNDANNVMDDLSVVEAVESLKAKIKSGKLRLKDLNGQFLMTSGAYVTVGDSSNYSYAILIVLCVTLLILILLIITTTYIGRKSRLARPLSKSRHEPYREFTFGRDSVGKYSYDSGLWLGPGPEPNFTVPDAPLYRPPTVDQISSTPRPVTAVRTRLKKNWNIDERALSTIPDDLGRTYMNSPL